ncbi:MAG: hypothetical protein V3W34_04245 [Phycisphaerae bacterium]
MSTTRSFGLRCGSRLVGSRCASGLVLLTLLASTPGAMAQTFWNTGQDGDWFDGGNWTLGVPVIGTDAFINSPPDSDAYTVAIDGNVNCCALARRLGMAPAFPGAVLFITNNAVLDVEQEITIGPSAVISLDRFTSLSAGTNTWDADPDIIIEGVLELLRDAHISDGSIENRDGGEIRVNVTGGCCNPTGIRLHDGINDGLIAVTSGGPGSGTMLERGGTACCDITNSLTGVIDLRAAELGFIDPLVNNGVLRGYGVVANSSGFTNFSTVLVEEGGPAPAWESLWFDGGWTNEMGGNVTLADGILNGSMLTNLGTLQGNGTVQIFVENHGLVTVDTRDNLVFDSGGLLDNQEDGTVLMNGGILSGWFSNNGTITGSGSILGNFGNSGTIWLPDGETLAITAATGGGGGGEPGGRDSSNGQADLVGGGLWVNSSDGQIDLAGGTLTGGQFWNSGLIDARAGTSSIMSDVFLTSGSTVNVAATLVSGGTMNLGGQSVSSNGDGGGLWINDGTVMGPGTIGVDFENRGSVFANGQLRLTAASNNLGSIALGWFVSGTLLVDGTLTNGGFLTLFAGQVAGGGTVENGPSGTIMGFGLITAALDNAGGQVVADGGQLTITNLAGPQNGRLTVLDGAGMTAVGGFSNNGQIILSGATAQFGGGEIENWGRIAGRGTVTNDITNVGVIEPEAGRTLTLSGQVTNLGMLAARDGATLYIGPVPIFPVTSSGLILIEDGIIEFHLADVTNTGIIAGFGDLRAATLNNDGVMELLTGVSFVDAAVNNNATLNMTTTTVIFTGPVVNSGSIKTTDAVVIFADEFTNNGAYISDPSTQSFGRLTNGPTGTLIGGVGDVFVVSRSFDNQSTNVDAWDTAAAELQFISGGPAIAVEAAGEDLGPVPAGLVGNFSIGILRVSGVGTEVQVVDLHDNTAGPGSEAVYADTIILESGTTFTLGEGNVYYRTLDMGGGVTINEDGAGRLLRIVRPGDFNNDGVVDLFDYAAFVGCVTGPDAGPPAPGCEVFDFDTDDDVDLIDWSGFQSVFGTP